MDFERIKDVLLQVELEHRLLVALVSPAWVTRSSRILRLMEGPAGVEREVAARDAEELSQSPPGGRQTLLKH